MRNLIAALVALLTALSSTFINAQNQATPPKGFKEQKTPAIAFTENKGQVYDQNYKPRPDVLYGTMEKAYPICAKKAFNGSFLKIINPIFEII